MHYNGVGCGTNAIMDIATRDRLHVLEDNARGLFGLFEGRALGSFGEFASLSLHSTKNITCGEGGALLVNKPELVDTAHAIRDKGTNRREFELGLVSICLWVSHGTSHLMSDLQAAVLNAQLTSAEEIQQRRRQQWSRYARELSDWCERNGILIQAVPPECTHAAHVFSLCMPTPGIALGSISE